MCEGKVHCLGHRVRMEGSVSTHIISETLCEDACHESPCISEEYEVMDIGCDELIYQVREVISSVTPTQKDSIYSLDGSDRCDRALRSGRDRVIVEGDVLLGADSL